MRSRPGWVTRALYVRRPRASWRSSHCPGWPECWSSRCPAGSSATGRPTVRTCSARRAPRASCAEATLAAESGDQILDPAGLFFGGGLLRLDRFDEVLAQTHTIRRFLGRQLGPAAGNVEPLPQRRTRPVGGGLDQLVVTVPHTAERDDHRRGDAAAPSRLRQRTLKFAEPGEDDACAV